MTGATAPVPGDGLPRDLPTEDTAAGQHPLYLVARPGSDPTDLVTSSRREAEPAVAEHLLPLWSRRTAEAIERDLRQDVANGDLCPADATELTARVWARTQTDTLSTELDPIERDEVTSCGRVQAATDATTAVEPRNTFTRTAARDRRR